VAEPKNIKKKPANPVDDAVLEKTTELVGSDIEGIDTDRADVRKDVDEELEAAAGSAPGSPSHQRSHLL